MDADIIVVGPAWPDSSQRPRRPTPAGRSSCVDQEAEQSLGGQAHWSLGGLFLVDTPEQRLMGIKDSHDLALSDWFGSAQFDREEDRWPRAGREAYVDFAAGRSAPGSARWDIGSSRSWAGPSAATVAPTGTATRCPRFHLTWGTGPGVVAPFERRVREHVATGLVTFAFRHRVDELVIERRRRDRRTRRAARAHRHRARPGHQPRRGRRVRATPRRP